MRIILYLGKGGVGKTTVSAATAVRSARLGKRTLVVSTDLAHSLADCLRTPLTSEPQELETNLWAQEVNVLDEMRRGWSKLQHSMSKTLRQRGVNAVMAEELALIPGMDEIVSLVNIYRNAKEGQFEVVIIDAAPTGETVRLLSMPDTFQWYANRLNALQGTTLNLALALGGHVRVGFEDNIYYRKGQLATSNAQLVERIVRIASELDRPIATPEQARALLQLNRYT